MFYLKASHNGTIECLLQRVQGKELLTLALVFLCSNQPYNLQKHELCSATTWTTPIEVLIESFHLSGHTFKF